MDENIVGQDNHGNRARDTGNRIGRNLAPDLAQWLDVSSVRGR
jgi:hypothetical protein